MDVLLSGNIDLETVADLCQAGFKHKPPVPRDTKKFHVTNLLESARLISRGDNRYHEYEGHPSGIMSMGKIWEITIDCYLTHYASNLGGFYIPDMEQVSDGIIASLDGVMWLPEYGWLVCETKLRFTQNKEIPLSHLQQIRAYCHLANTDLVCYVSGHVSSTPPTARAEMRVIRLTRLSIEETWSMISNTKRYLEGLGITPNGNKSIMEVE